MLAALLCIPKDTKINPDIDFPEVHRDKRDIRDASFKVRSGHTKLFLPEQLLMTEDEYKKQQLQEQQQQKQQQQEQLQQLSQKALIAKQLEVSMKQVTEGELHDVDIDRQQELLAEAKAQLESEQKRVSEAPGDEEALAAGAGAHQLPSADHDPLAGMTPIELQQQRTAMEKYEREKKEAIHAKRQGGRQHTPQGAAPAVSYAAMQQHQIQASSWMTKDMVVALKYSDPPISGVVKYIGCVPGYNELVAGLELVRSDVCVSCCTSSVMTWWFSTACRMHP